MRQIRNTGFHASKVFDDDDSRERSEKRSSSKKPGRKVRKRQTLPVSKIALARRKRPRTKSTVGVAKITEEQQAPLNRTPGTHRACLKAITPGQIPLSSESSTAKCVTQQSAFKRNPQSAFKFTPMPGRFTFTPAFQSSQQENGKNKTKQKKKRRLSLHDMYTPLRHGESKEDAQSSFLSPEF
jgi:hypothetical protein